MKVFHHDRARRGRGVAVGVLAAAVLGSMLGFAPAAHADEVYDVPCNVDSLIQRIEDANSDGDDSVLRLAKKCKYKFDERFETFDFALPEITDALTIFGRGATLERDVDDEDSQWSHFSILNISADTEIQDLKITDGSLLVPPNGSAAGGCVAINSADVLMRKVTVEDCKVFAYDLAAAAAMGGAIFNDGGELSMDDSSVKDSEVTVIAAGAATGSGGGIWSSNTLNLEDTDVKGNEVSGSAFLVSANGGGGIYVDDASELNMLDGSVTKNSVTSTGGSAFLTFGLGGGLYLGDGSDSEIADSSVSKNTAKAKGNASAAAGGGIINLGALAVDTDGGDIDEDDLDETDIKDNKATCDGFCLAVGGGYVNTDGSAVGTATFTDTTFKGNKADGDEGVGLGGGLFVTGTDSTLLVDSEVTKNTAKGDIWGAGGGIFATDDDVVTLDDTDVEKNKPDNCWNVPAC